MSRICLYYRLPAEVDRWLPGDRFVRPLVRRVIRGKGQTGGVERVFLNLCVGLDRLKIPYTVNLPFRALQPDDRVAVLGRGRASLAGYDRPNPIVAGIGLMTHPSEWPTLCTDYPVVRYLQHCQWASQVYRPYFGDRCGNWPVGIDTQAWAPAAGPKTFDFLIYDKIRWNRDTLVPGLLAPIEAELRHCGLTFNTIRYGSYDPHRYRDLLHASRAMIFLCEHESQGLAYQECLASGVPVLAWDNGFCLDPERFNWGTPEIPASSVPFFDAGCGVRFRDVANFSSALGHFLDLQAAGQLAPREYILGNLTLEKCSADFVRWLDEAQAARP